MKRLSAALLLTIFTLHAFGYFFTYRVIKWHIHHEVSTRIEQGLYHSSALTLLHLNPAQVATLHWEEEGEFCYQNEWYDVVEVQQFGTQTVYYCIKDQAESRLVAGFENILKDVQQESSQNNFRYTLKKLSDVFYSILPQHLIYSFIERSIFSVLTSADPLMISLSFVDQPPEN